MKRTALRAILLAMGLCGLVFGVLAQQTVSNTAVTASEFSQLISNIRADLETLADLAFGGGTRPVSWTGNADQSSVSIVADIWFDNEQLADQIFGTAQRPAAWIGATSSNAFLVVRNVRHDLELAADELLGAGTRPQAWQGAPKVYRCSRTLQNTLYLLRILYNNTPTTLESVFDYCAAVAGELETTLTQLASRLQTGQTVDYNSLILAVRGDIERLADERLGLNTRPEGWRANKDVNSPNLATDNLADLELLADTLLGAGQRPFGWLGIISAEASVTARNLRFDLELLTDATLGEGVRPRGWQGVDPLAACPPATQNLVALVSANYGFQPLIPEGVSNDEVCAAVEQQANLAAENPPVVDAGGAGGAEDERNIAESRIAFAYLDTAATQFMGEMPSGVRFRAWYRNFGESTMMFVSGEDFAVFVDRRWTTMDQERFNRLPTLEGVRPLTFCNASWCNGPRATPTPTGDVLFDIITAATPPATVAPGQNTDASGKKLVSWNHIRVQYIAQNSSPGRAQVALEICQEPEQVICEPVLSILNTITGVPVPVLSSVNGLNVFELPYGYSTNLLIEGSTLFSQDVWLNDPSITGSGGSGVSPTATQNVIIIQPTATP